MAMFRFIFSSSSLRSCELRPSRAVSLVLFLRSKNSFASSKQIKREQNQLSVCVFFHFQVACKRHLGFILCLFVRIFSSVVVELNNTNSSKKMEQMTNRPKWSVSNCEFSCQQAIYNKPKSKWSLQLCTEKPDDNSIYGFAERWREKTRAKCSHRCN